MAIQHGFSTHEQSTIKLNGGQWQENVTQLAIENNQLADAVPDESKQDPIAQAISYIVAEISKRTKEELHDEHN